MVSALLGVVRARLKSRFSHEDCWMIWGPSPSLNQTYITDDAKDVPDYVRLLQLFGEDWDDNVNSGSEDVQKPPCASSPWIHSFHIHFKIRKAAIYMFANRTVRFSKHSEFQLCIANTWKLWFREVYYMFANFWMPPFSFYKRLL